ncbi:glycosyltransferase family 2 protein [Corallincola platygyrae]|uniref:Glycosyltransferase family 2 protein n=1 Tax=Corallincola platygyrae TaxID=1193278 RepID=A0ABW4XQV1_9GAMM
MSSVAMLLEPREKTRPLVDETPLISVVIPIFNEQASIATCHLRVCSALDQLEQHCEIVYVDDGSSDASWALLQQLTSLRHQTVRLKLSRNFGKEAAMSAGIKQTKGKGVIILDADLQDPPELIPEMVEAWQTGVDVVEMQRRKRAGETWLKRSTAAAFYKIMGRLSEMPVPENVGDFRLLDRRVVDQINQLPERTRYMKGLFAWPGFNRTTLKYDRDPRLAGETKWNYTKLIDLAIEGITSFSTRPLRLATFAGLISLTTALVSALFLAYQGATTGLSGLSGHLNLTIVLLLGGIQLLAVGLLGEYVGRLFIEAKQRPLYIVMEETTSAAVNENQEVH